MPVGFDSTFLSALLNPKARVANDPATGKPVDLAKERIQALIVRLQKAREKIIIPAPAAAEVLTVLGPASAEYLQIINRARVFEVRSFDQVAAIELAFLNRDIFGKLDAKNKLEPWQKVKVDRQILAICRVAGCSRLYTDDESLINRSTMCEVETTRLRELPIPDDAKQGKLDLEQHEELPEPEGSDDEPSDEKDERR